MSHSSRNSIAVTWVAITLLFGSIACWLAWDWSAYLTEERIRAEKTAEYHDQYAEEAIDEKCLALDPIAMRDCIHEQIEAARDHERAEQDLDAQQTMARFTRVMGWTAVLGLILGGMSVGVIFFTLREMGRTNKIMREEQRPWLVIDDKSVPFSRLAKMYRSVPDERITIQATNKGRLPAKDAIATYIIFSRDTVTSEHAADVIEDTFINNFDLYFFEKGTIFQDEKSDLAIQPLPADKRVLGKGDDWVVMIVGIYFWDDDIKMVWACAETKRPPENVLNAQQG